MFFIAFGLMNETNTIASKETEKNGHKRAAPFQFIFLGLPYILYKNLHPLPTSTPHNLTVLSHFYLDLCPHLCLFYQHGTTFLLADSCSRFCSSRSQHIASSKPIFSQSLTL
ncbi:hypothetical protein CHARACLAT_014056 [Characodon lateralis]|uniref:Uncharacterized protein n=1 Tax=Characodon lateralis TaxID=208331 RepID=A0ABU7D8Y2_9TELE|nr:hypothetical protein [Characodon lateralis]